MLQRYNLYFKSPFNLLDSIKLSGAILSAAYKIYPQREKDITEEIKNFHLRVSDSFPVDQINGGMLFPVPLLPYTMPKNKDRKERIREAMDRKKTVPYAKFESVKLVLRKFLDGGISKNEATDLLTDKEQGREFVPSYYNEASEYGVNLQDDEPMVYVRELVKVGYLERRKIGNLETLSYNPVYFIADYSIRELAVSMAFLEDAGLSAMFSRGKGNFVYQKDTPDIKTGFTGAGYYMILSKYCPAKEDFTNIDLEKSYYSLGTFTGVGQGNKGLPKIRYLKVGSIVYLNGDINGRVIFAESGNRILNFSAMITRVI